MLLLLLCSSFCPLNRCMCWHWFPFLFFNSSRWSFTLDSVLLLLLRLPSFLRGNLWRKLLFHPWIQYIIIRCHHLIFQNVDLIVLPLDLPIHSGILPALEVSFSSSFVGVSAYCIKMICRVFVFGFLIHLHFNCRYSTLLDSGYSPSNHWWAYGSFRFSLSDLLDKFHPACIKLVVWKRSLFVTMCSKCTCISGEVAKRQRWGGKLQGKLWWQRYDTTAVEWRWVAVALVWASGFGFFDCFYIFSPLNSTCRSELATGTRWTYTGCLYSDTTLVLA